jgi:hypothetical protein
MLRDGACLELDAEGTAGLGFQDGKHGCRLTEVVHFFLLGRCEVIILIPHGELVHAGLVELADRKLEDVAGDGLGELGLAVGQEAGEDRHLVVAIIRNLRLGSHDLSSGVLL